MPTRLTPTCDECGGPPGTGFLMDPKSLKVRCVNCAIPDETARERIVTDSVRGLLRECEEALGHRPSLPEFMECATREEAA